MLFFFFLKSNFALHKTSRITKFPCNMDEIEDILYIFYISSFFQYSKIIQKNSKKVQENVTWIWRSRTRRSGIELIF